ncbi:hypothetical protein GR138_12110 [Shinella kummerowiae]|uniref:Uncharacterized protein n=1 Tax=Shinella kummerowiae TaxID=417745 RepID=A0A6N8SEC6_9HYPH|nr:hypothetical protein [Shinella kummerowiae]MXN45938.1 hypothetical protein [Shinella kummerowiae]
MVDMDESRPALKVGDKVRVRSGSTLERTRWNDRNAVGIVVEVAHIPAFGRGVKIRWPNEDVEPAFSEAGQYDLVEGA